MAPLELDRSRPARSPAHPSRGRGPVPRQPQDGHSLGTRRQAERRSGPSAGTVASGHPRSSSAWSRCPPSAPDHAPASRGPSRPTDRLGRAEQATATVATHGHTHRRLLRRDPRPARQRPGHPRPAGGSHRRRGRQHRLAGGLRGQARRPRRGPHRELLGRGPHRRGVSRPSIDIDGVEVLSVSDRTFDMHDGGKIEVLARMPVARPRRPLDGVHAGRRPRLHRDRGQPGAGARAHDQEEHGRHRHRRHRGARPRQHRPGGLAAGDGGQGAPVQELRRRRRVPDLHRHRSTTRRWRSGSTPSSRRSSASLRCSAASTSRTSPRRRASRSRTACASSSTSPSSTTTSTAPPSSRWPRWRTRCSSSTSRWTTSAS